MAEHDPDAALRTTEPDTIRTRFVTIVKVEATAHIVRITGLDDLMVVGYDGPERRLVDRVAMPVDTARELHRKLERALKRAAHH
jgi:hypothetical protein